MKLALSKMIVSLENIENNLTMFTYSAKVCPLISITGVFKLVISQSAYLKGETSHCAVWHHGVYHTEHGLQKAKQTVVEITLLHFVSSRFGQ